MRAMIRQIGNSKGIIIPASFLAEAGLQGEIEMSLKEDGIFIQAIKKKSRQNWFNTYKASEDEDAWDGFIEMENDTEDREW